MKIPSSLLTPWAITREGLDAVINAASRDDLLSIFKPVQSLVETEPSSIRVISVNGTLFNHDTPLSLLLGPLLGVKSYDAIRRELDAAMVDKTVKAIVFSFDSPGGEVQGASELSKAVYEARQSSAKPIIGHVSGLCGSAAYWIASACESLSASRTAIVGSIGVIGTLIDDSKRDEMAGIEKYQVVSSQSPYKVVDPSKSADRARVQERINAMAQVFIDDVARNRGVKAETVESAYGQGDVFVGEHAVTAGLVDSLGDLESLLSQLTQPRNKRGALMSAKNTAQASASMNTGACDGCSKAMDDDDDMYCDSCYSSADAKALASIVALTGEATSAAAIGFITALKAKAEQADKLVAELAEIKGKQAASEIVALIDGAVTERKIGKGEREKLEKLAADHGVEALKACVAIMPKAVAAAIEPTIKAETVIAQSSDIEKLLRATGVTAEGLVEQRKKVFGAFFKPSEEA